MLPVKKGFLLPRDRTQSRIMCSATALPQSRQAIPVPTCSRGAVVGCVSLEAGLGYGSACSFLTWGERLSGSHFCMLGLLSLGYSQLRAERPLPRLQECRLVQAAIDHSRRSLWGAVLEQMHLPAPEVYQNHLLVKELGRKGIAQPRVLAVSDARIHSIRRDGVELLDTSWSCEVDQLQGVQLHALEDKRAPQERWGLTLQGRLNASEDTIAFAVKTEKQLHELASCLCQVYFASTHTQLKVGGLT